MRVLIAHSASVHALDRYTWTPLFHTVRCSRADVEEELVKAVADVHATDIFGLTAMFQVNITIDLVLTHEVPIKHGTSVQVVSMLMDTLLHRAAIYEVVNTARFLVDQKYSLTRLRRTKHRYTELRKADFVDVVTFLLDRGAAAYGDLAIPNLLLFAAALYDHVRIVTDLTARGVTFRFDDTALENIVVTDFVLEDN